MKTRDQFDSLAPIDYRYWDEEVAMYLSENGFTRYKLLVELALLRVLNRHGICPEVAVTEVEAACGQVTTAEVYEEEDRIRHDIRALVNCIRAKVSDSAKPYVHMTATSYDIIDPANAARYKDAVEKVLVPSLTKLEEILIVTTLREAETVQVGRTHGQHAVPITFGFALAGYVSRLGGSIEALKALATELPGKFSGAVGAYNASSLFFDDPEGFEAEVLAELGLTPAEHSTQIVPPEALTRLFCEVTIAAGVLANLSDDMRNLQRTEIGEVGEEFEAAQVGSSTMPQKRNPINFENAKSCWKIVAPRIVTVFMDQISEHQRDLTNSASARTYGEVVAYVVSTAKRLTLTMKKLTVDRVNLERNLAMQKGLVVAEPLYIILAAHGHPDAHEKVRTLTLQAQREPRPLEEVVVGDVGVKDYLEKMTPYQRQILSNPSLYTGIAAKKAIAVAERWQQKLNLNSTSTEQLLVEGKTKKILMTNTPGRVIVESKDDLTAGDGAKHDIISGKASLSNRTTSNVFRLLKACGLPIAFVEEVDGTRFLAEQCDMIPYEVVVRREAHGSFLKRHPGLQKGHVFSHLLLEFFLKTSGKKWKDADLPKDDPFMRFDGDHASLYLPDQPIHQQTPFLVLDNFPLRESPEGIKQIGEIATTTFLILEKAWQLVGRRLVDFKVEFGVNTAGELRLADVIDNDSWRVLDDGKYIDKQLYRDGVDLNTVTAKYRLVAELTGNFTLPRQQIVLWRASASEDLKPFEDAITAYGASGVCSVKVATCSLHKEPVRACEEIGKLIQGVPDSVVIVFCGRSNGAGPTLSAQCAVPVITVPATWREFPEDVWSSLRTPSETPVATILDPKNAVLSALQILAMRNPRLYAELRFRQEARLCNIVRL